MPGLQGIDSDYTSLTQGNEALTQDESIKPISSGNLSENYPQTPIGMLSPTDRDLISQASTPGQDIQRSVADIQKPNLGIMMLLGAIGGPQVVNQYYSRTMQKQIEPIVGGINLQYRQALNTGDFEGAQKLVNQLAPLVQYSPTAGKLYENFTNEIAKRQDNVQQNKITASAMLQAVRPGSSAERFYENPANYLMDKQQFDKMGEIFKESGQVIDGIWTTTENLTGRPIEQYPMPGATKAETLPKPTQDAIITELGTEYIPEYARLQTLVSTGKANNGEILAFNMMNKVIGGQAAQNIRIGQFPIPEQVKTGATPQEVKGITSAYPVAPTQGTQSQAPQGNIQPRPQGNIKGKGPIPSTGRSDEENQGIIARLGEAVAQGKMSQGEMFDTLGRLGIPINMPQGGVASTLRERQARAEIGEAGGKAAVEHQMEAKYKPQPQLVGYKLTKDGELLQSPPGLSTDDLKNKGWHAETMPDEQRKTLVNYAQFNGAYKEIEQQIQNNPIFRDKSTWNRFWETIGTHIQQGVSLPKIISDMRVGGMGSTFISPDRANLNAALASMAQVAEIASNPGGQDNAGIAALKNVLTSPSTTPEHIMATLDGVRSVALGRVKGIIGTTPGAVEEGVSGRDIRRERESKPVDKTEKYREEAPMGTTPEGTVRKKRGTPLDIDKLEGVKSRLDRSKFKPVGP